MRHARARAEPALLLAAALAGCAAPVHSPSPPTMNWQQLLADRLAVFGHRNWIVVADSAYPAQSRPGVETVSTGASHLEVLGHVLRAVDRARHVRPLVLLDAELDRVPEADAPGIDACRAALRALLGSRPTRSRPHEQIIRDLDEAGAVVKVLILKTDLALPYTSVFLELQCGYWEDDAERRLRAR
jgi:hypothetical protein